MTAALPLISAGLGGVLIIMSQTLMLSVGMHRTRTKRGVGYGDDVTLERKIRRHGNLIENAPMFVLVLALLEMAGGSQTAVLAFAGVFLIARICHAIGFSSLSGSHQADSFNVFLGLRAVGATTTALVGIMLGGYLLFTLSSL